MKEKIKRIIEKIKDIFSLHCPECGVRMENSIEKDIEIIEDFILKTDVDYSEYNEQIVGDISYQAIQHLLSAYQEVLKENEQLRTEVNSLKKDISNMYDEEVIISIISDNFNLSRNEVLKLLGGE